MNAVGPVTSTNRPSTPVRIMFVFDSNRMPRFTPDTADAMKSEVRIAMDPMRNRLPSGPIPVTSTKPLWICSAPIPSETAVPKRVTRIAKKSMNLPSTRWLEPGNTGSKRAEMSGARPPRYAL